MRKNKNTGFTLLEMLVVVAIALMILSFVLVYLRNVKTKNRDSRREQDIKQIQNALALYEANTNVYPQCATEVVIGGGETCVGPVLVSGGIIPSAPIDPLMRTSGTCGGVGSYAYCYRAAPGATTIYELRYALESDAIPGKSPGWQTAIGP